MREGDVVTVCEYSRFGIDTLGLIRLIEDLNNKGINVVSDKEKLDTRTPQGRLMLTVFAGFAEFNNSIMQEKQSEKKNSMPECTKIGYLDKDKITTLMKEANLKFTDLANDIDVSVSMLCRYLNGTHEYLNKYFEAVNKMAKVLGCGVKDILVIE